MNHDAPMPPAERERLAQELLELHFGCHEHPEVLQARLDREPALRALQREVLLQARVLERAVRPEQAPLPLRTPRPTNALRRWHSPAWRLLGAAAAAALIVGGLFVAARVAQARHAEFQREHLHLTVAGPRAVPAGAPFAFTVQAKDLTGGAIDCKVQWEAYLADGSLLAANEVAVRDGAATITLAADPQLRVPDRIAVTARLAGDTVRQVLPLSAAAAGPLVHVTTDRPVYRPGEPVFVRAVVLDRVTALPLPGPLQLAARLVDAKGALVAGDHDVVVPNGTGSFVLGVPASSNGGPHRVQVQYLQGSLPLESVDIVVRSFQPPQLQKTVVLDRASYAPGARGSATVTALRLAAGGGGASGASARGALVIDGAEVWNEKRALGQDGAATFAFTIPKDVDKGAARFVATIDDGGIIETEVKPFVVPTGKVFVAAFPEGGELVAGVENAIYLEVTDALGRPIDGAGDVVDARDRVVAKFRTQHQGRTKLALQPRGGETYRVRLTGHATPFPLPEVKASGVALRLLGDDVAATAPLRVGIAGRGNGPWLLGVFCRGVLVGQTTLRADDSGELREQAIVELPPTAAGVLRVTVFDRELQPIAERLVRRLARHRLDVELAAQHASLSPGEAQQIRVRTTDETGTPRAAVVGLSVSDQAIHALGSEPAIGLVDHAMLFADVERTENLGDFFLAGAGAATNVDLLLGTRGWRRFVWRNDAAAQATIAARGPAAEGTLAREGFSQTPQVVSNLQAAQAAAGSLGRDAWRAERRLADAAGLAGLGLVLLLLGEFVAWLARRAQAQPLVQWTAGVGTSVALLGLLVLMPQSLGGRMAVDALAPSAAADFGGRPAGFDVFALADDAGAPETKDFDVEFAQGAVLRWDGSGLPDPNRAVSGEDTFFVGAAVRDAERWDDLPVVNPVARLPFALGGGGGDASVMQGGFHFFRQDDVRFDSFDRGTIRVRQYAHQHTPSDDRRDFTPTIFWNPLVATDAQGNAAVTFATSDAVTTWRVHADTHAPTGTGRLGQATIGFTTRLPLHVECKLPDEVSAGDRLLLPVSAVVTDAGITEVTLTAVAADGLRLDSGSPDRIALQDGRGRALLPLVVADAPGAATLRIEASTGRFRDVVTHRLVIAPRGFPHRRSLAGSVEPGKPAGGTLTIPPDPVAGSGRVTLKVYPSPISALTEGLEGILREPHGCFEQASSSNYPNTLVLNLLEANGDDLPVVASRARALLPKGYAKITGYECKRRGYEWFGADPGHEALTAYGLLQFHDMQRVHDVDAAMVDRTRAWLLARRDGKGNFVHQGTDHHSFGGRSQVLTNAYVVYALLQAGTPAAELRAEIDALLARTTIDDPYELALIACALHLAQRPEASAVRARLATLQRSNGSLRGTTTTITSSGGNDLVVETTGFAILAWLPDPAFAAHVRSAIEFVNGSRSATGTFGATQATIVALRALTAYATATRSMRSDGTLRVFAGDRLLAERAFAATETAALVFELWDQLPPGEHTLRLEVEGGGAPLPWACDVAYHAELPADDADAALAIATSLRAPEANEGATVALDVVVTNRTDREVPTPIAVIGLPAGCELPTRVLDDLLRADAFASWELRGRELVLYWRALDAKAERRLTLDLVARVPGTTAGPASRAWLYYTPAQKRWAAPLQLAIAPQ
jgi:hypothetical protein